MSNALDLFSSQEEETEKQKQDQRIQGWLSNSLEVLLGQNTCHFSIDQWKAWEGASSLENDAEFGGGRKAAQH